MSTDKPTKDITIVKSTIILKIFDVKSRKEQNFPKYVPFSAIRKIEKDTDVFWCRIYLVGEENYYFANFDVERLINDLSEL